VIWRFRCGDYSGRVILVYRGLAAVQDGNDLRVYGRQNTPTVTVSHVHSYDAVYNFVDGVVALIGRTSDVASWDDVPWEIHCISDKIPREAAYRGWTSQMGALPTDRLVQRLNQWFHGDLYEVY